MDKGRKVMEGNPARLLETEIEPYVLELLNKRAAADLDRRVDGSVRKEEAAERVLYYGNEQKMLDRMSKALSPDEYYLRKTNLEDIFLKATGRDLNAGQ
jgi:lipooligosaccharide transport system ATP-binding protein